LHLLDGQLAAAHRTALRGRKIKIYVKKRIFAGEWSNPVRSAERGVRNGKLGKWSCLLVNGEVSGAQKWFGMSARIPDSDGRKRGVFGHYKKSFFGSAKKRHFSAVFENG